MTTRIEVVFEQFGAVAWRLIRGVTHHIAHQPNEGQVDRLADGLAQGRVAAIVLIAEVVKVMHAATGEEAFAGACGVLAVERGIEHVRQAGAGVPDQVIQRPAAQAVLVIDLDFLQVGAGLSAVAIMQLGHDLQVSGHDPQFGGRAQLQFAAFVNVKRLIGAVGLDPGAGAIGCQFKQGEAVTHLRSAGGRQ